MNKREFCEKYFIADKIISIEILQDKLLNLFGSVNFTKFNEATLNDGTTYPTSYFCGVQEEWGYCKYSIDNCDNVLSAMLTLIDKHIPEDERFTQILRDLKYEEFK